MGDRSNTTAERRHVSPLLALHLWRICHFKEGGSVSTPLTSSHYIAGDPDPNPNILSLILTLIQMKLSVILPTYNERESLPIIVWLISRTLVEQ